MHILKVVVFSSLTISMAMAQYKRHYQSIINENGATTGDDIYTEAITYTARDKGYAFAGTFKPYVLAHNDYNRMLLVKTADNDLLTVPLFHG